MYLTAASQHLYEKDYDKVIRVFENPKTLPYQPFDIYRFEGPKNLTQWLIDKANQGDLIQTTPKEPEFVTDGN